MEILTDLQKEILGDLSRTDLKESFFLTGGTALSAFYLRHRLSDDLDFFTPAPGAVPSVLPRMKEVAASRGLRLTVRRQFRTFLELHLEGRGERLRVDFAEDSPFRLEPVRAIPPWDFPIDNPTDIACNKLSALFDRADPKDFVDVFFIDREILPLSRLVGKAKQKHVGFDEYWLAVAFSRIESVAVLPRMIRPVTLEELRAFYSEAARNLLEGLKRE
ncbi:MAG: hypothetical protein Kow00128_16730 [Deltaproteobacteria bacterium]